MNQWSARRKRIILLITLLSLVLLVGVPLFFFLYKAPTCVDNKQNGDETGVDCGGSCSLICMSEALPLITKGDPRVLKVATSTFEVIAHVQNPNVSAKVLTGAYIFKLYELGNTVPIRIIEGSTYIPAGSTFIVFEGPFNTGETVPVRATFAWLPETLVWEKEINDFPEVLIQNIILTNELIEPRLDATIKNDSLVGVTNIELVSIVSDRNGNIIGSSKTFVDRLNPGDSAPLVFKWPAPFVGTSSAVEIFPRIFPDKSFIK